jgi:signal transduction histidine kinase
MLVVLTASHWSRIVDDLPELGVWVILLVAVYSFPLHSRSAELFNYDWPVMTAIALLFSPIETGLIAFVVSFDKAEFQRDGALFKTAYNHSQISSAWFIGSLAAHAFDVSSAPPLVLVPIAVAVLLVSVCLNYVLVGVPLAVQLRYPIRDAIARLRVGSTTDFALALLAGASMGAMLAIVYRAAGLWMVPVFAAPILLTRHALARSQTLIELSRAYREREAALVHMADQIDRERTDERRLIAADLHDEVLQPLFTVSLLGQTLRNDLATGRLLEIEEDLPKLVSATDEAAETVRRIVGDLRRSGLGREGLTSALRRLATVAQEQTKIEIHCSLSQKRAVVTGQLALYQIAKEALGNVLRHSRANHVWIVLTQDEGAVTLEVRDDGIGFDQAELYEDHYGLLIMRERAASAGGSLYVDSAPGEGCHLRAVIPQDNA